MRAYLDGEVGAARRVLTEANGFGRTEHFTPVPLAERMTPGLLVDLTKLQPESRAALAEIPGLSELQVRRYGDDLLRSIQDGRTRPLPPLPNGDGRPEHKLDKAAQAGYDARRRWRTETARTRGKPGPQPSAHSSEKPIAGTASNARISSHFMTNSVFRDFSPPD